MCLCFPRCPSCASARASHEAPAAVAVPSGLSAGREKISGGCRDPTGLPSLRDAGSISLHMSLSVCGCMVLELGWESIVSPCSPGLYLCSQCWSWYGQLGPGCRLVWKLPIPRHESSEGFQGLGEPSSTHGAQQHPWSPAAPPEPGGSPGAQQHPQSPAAPTEPRSTPGAWPCRPAVLPAALPVLQCVHAGWRWQARRWQHAKQAVYNR